MPVPRSKDDGQLKFTKKTGITKDHALNHNFDDWHACFEQDPMPPVPVHTFFDKKQKKGPYAAKNYNGQQKALDDRATEIFEVWKQKKAAASLKVSASGTVVENLKQTRKDDNKQKMAQAQTKAKERLEATKNRRKISF